MNKKSILKVFLIVSGIATCSIGHSLTRQGAYLNLGVGYVANLASGNANKYLISQPAVPGTSTLMHDNASDASGFDISVGAGYQWRLIDGWSLSLGGRLSRSMLVQSGVWQYFSNGAYSYAVDINDVSAVSQILYTWEKWQFYGGLHAGAAFIASDSYTTNNSGGGNFDSKVVINPSYGGELGVVRYLSDTIGVGVTLSYSDFGNAELGSRMIPSPSTNSGEMKQRLQVVTVSLNFMKRF